MNRESIMIKENVLVIDDSIFICNIVEKQLASESINILRAYDGKSALDMVKEIKPNLILLDLMLPDMDGYDVCKKIKEVPANDDIPIIFLTSKGDEDSIVKAFKVGAIDYISKPFSTIELDARVKAHLENKRIKDALRQINIELENALAENKRLAYTDKLTGLYNRHYFLENIEKFRENSKLNNTNLWIALFDIDDFKKINDIYGHHHGDFVLANVALIIDKHCSQTGMSCRWGGEEFISAVYDVSDEELEVKIQSICNEVYNYNFKCGDIDVHCTLSVGISKFDFSLSIDENIILSDKAMYYKKRNGKNGYYFSRISN